MERKVIYQGRRITLVNDTLTHPSGASYSRVIVQHPGAVVILPLVDDDHVCLVRQWRHAVQETLLELPAGTLEPPEDPLTTAQRELAEETGYTAADWTALLTFYPSPGLLTERMFLFAARQLSPGIARPELDENLEPVIVSLNEALELVDCGQIMDAKTLVGLLWWERRGRRATKA